MERRYKNGFSLKESCGSPVPMTYSRFLLSLQKEWFFHWDNAPVPVAPVLKKWFADHSIEHLQHLDGPFLMKTAFRRLG